MQEQKGDYHGHTIENMALVGGQLPEHKSRTLPESNRSHPTRSHSTSTEPGYKVCTCVASCSALRSQSHMMLVLHVSPLFLKLLNSPFLSSQHPLYPLSSLNPLQPNRPPPPVIPYQRHLEGKRKLAESLRQSGIMPDAADRNRTNSLSNVPVGVLLNLTPPDTPHSAPSAEPSSLDLSERVSLDSKGSNEASIASGEVATGNLVDLSSSGVILL